MGIVIRLDLVKNKEELNVKVLNDDGLADSVGGCELANFNVAINKTAEKNEADITVESVRSKYIGSTHEQTESVKNAEKKSATAATVEHQDEVESEDSLEEYFVVDKIIGNRFNPCTKQYEFLLKLKDCQPINNTWQPVLNSKATSLSEEDGCLYIQKSKSLTLLKQKFRSQCSVSGDRENQLKDRPSEKHLHSTPFVNAEIGGNVDSAESGDPASDVFDVDESFHEKLPVDDNFCVDTDSTQDVNDVTIKCEAVIENEEESGNEYTNSVTYEKHSLANDSIDSADASIQEDVKPCLSYIGSDISHPFMCNLCGRSFTGIQYLRKHEKIHSKAVFTCSVCSYAFSNLHLLTVHERDGHGIRHIPKRRGCPPGSRRRPIETQLQTTSSFVKPLPLQEPVASFVSPLESRIRVSSFAKSLESQISDFAKPFKCPLCARTFRNQHALALHEGVHNDGRLFSCNVCDRVFTYLHALRNHERIHLNVKPVPCSYCGKLFTMESRRKLHERKHRIDLRNQRLINTVPIPTVKSREDVEKPYVCRYCSKAFRLKHTLVVHTRIHTGEKPFACIFCDYRSSQKISLDCHMRKHEKSWMQHTAY